MCNSHNKITIVKHIQVERQIRSSKGNLKQCIPSIDKARQGGIIYITHLMYSI